MQDENMHKRALISDSMKMIEWKKASRVMDEKAFREESGKRFEYDEPVLQGFRRINYIM